MRYLVTLLASWAVIFGMLALVNLFFIGIPKVSQVLAILAGLTAVTALLSAVLRLKQLRKADLNTH